MGKKKDADARVKRDLVEARLKLEVAQERLAQERVRGQQAIEKARLKAAKWQARAAQRVDRRSQAVATVEAQLAPKGVQTPEIAPRSPEDTVEVLQHIEAQAPDDNNKDGILTPFETRSQHPEIELG